MSETESGVYHDNEGMPPLMRGIEGIVDQYDAFVLDIWGVLHNGVRPYDGVLECLLRLQDAGKEVLLLTNSPNRAYMVAEGVLGSMGIHKGEHYQHLVSSGEAAWRALSAREGHNCYLFWPQEDPTALEGHNMRLVEDIDDAEFMLASLLPAGSRDEDYRPILQQARALDLPLYCANPDKFVNIGESLHLCAGALGDMYEDMGGTVHWYGKPYAPIYQQAFDLLSVKDTSRILAVGDSLRTDVRGANKAGIDVLWNLVGIHWEELRHVNEHGERVAHPQRLSDSLSEYDACPTALLRGLAW